MESKKIKSNFPKIYYLYPINYIPNNSADNGITFIFNHCLFELRKGVFVEDDLQSYGYSNIMPDKEKSTIKIPTNSIFENKEDCQKELVKRNRENIQNILQMINAMSDDIAELKEKFNKLKNL
jgi:hypothetical protein